MKTSVNATVQRLWLGWVLAGITALSSSAASRLEIQMAGAPMAPMLKISGDLGSTNQIQYANDLSQMNNWITLTNKVLSSNPTLYIDPTATGMAKRFYRVVVAGTNDVPPTTNVPNGMVLIPAGPFTMGDAIGDGRTDERPLHAVSISAFCMETNLVTKALWDEVYLWAIIRDYSFDNSGFGKAYDHPVHSVNWYDAVKWCNARSEMEGRVPAYYTNAAQTMVYRSGRVDIQNSWVKWNGGYRLPTESEWEKAARGGLKGKRFPWGDTITQSQANYLSYWSGGQPYYAYDLNTWEGYNSVAYFGMPPFTSPVVSFEANGYGLYDMAGNVYEWCWDWYAFYTSGSQSDPRGQTTASVYRTRRGGAWYDSALHCQLAHRTWSLPDWTDYGQGVRCVLPLGQ